MYKNIFLFTLFTFSTIHTMHQNTDYPSQPKKHYVNLGEGKCIKNDYHKKQIATAFIESDTIATVSSVKCSDETRFAIVTHYPLADNKAHQKEFYALLYAAVSACHTGHSKPMEILSYIVLPEKKMFPGDKTPQPVFTGLDEVIKNIGKNKCVQVTQKNFICQPAASLKVITANNNSCNRKGLCFNVQIRHWKPIVGSSYYTKGSNGIDIFH